MSERGSSRPNTSSAESNAQNSPEKITPLLDKHRMALLDQARSTDPYPRFRPQVDENAPQTSPQLQSRLGALRRRMMDLITEKPSPHTETQQEMTQLQSSETSALVDSVQYPPQSSLPRPQLPLPQAQSPAPTTPLASQSPPPTTPLAPQSQSPPPTATLPPQSPQHQVPQSQSLPSTHRAVAKMLGMMGGKAVPITGRHQEMAATANTISSPYPGGHLRSSTPGRERRNRLRSATDSSQPKSAGQTGENSQYQAPIHEQRSQSSLEEQQCLDPLRYSAQLRQQEQQRLPSPQGLHVDEDMDANQQPPGSYNSTSEMPIDHTSVQKQRSHVEEDVNMQPSQSALVLSSSSSLPPAQAGFLSTTPLPGDTHQPTDQSSSRGQTQSVPASDQPVAHVEEDIDMQPSQSALILSPSSCLTQQQPIDQSSLPGQTRSASVSGQPTVAPQSQRLPQAPFHTDINLHRSEAADSSRFCYTCPRTMHGLHSASNLITKTFEESFNRTAETVIAKVIESHITPILQTIGKGPSGKARAETTTPSQASNQGATDVQMSSSGADSEDFDGESDGAYRQRRRKRKSRRGLNLLHSLFRAYLVKNGVLLSAKLSLPQSASCEDIMAYETDGNGGPTLPGIRLDWDSSLKSSVWNDAAITLLATDFRSELKKQTTLKYDHQTMNLGALKKLCVEKLVRTRRAVRREGVMQTLDKEARATTEFGLQEVAARTQKANRQCTRRRSTHDRRTRIVRENSGNDATTWGQIEFILDALGHEGMSGDESDWQDSQGHSCRSKRKKLKRLELPWRNSKLAELFSSVDTYEGVVRGECFMNPRGNRPLERLDDTVVARSVKPVRGLPRNLYKDDWYRGLTSAAKLSLQPRKPIPIPQLAKHD